MSEPPRTPPTSGWTMWLAVWLATVVASGLAVLGSWQLTSETFEARIGESLLSQATARAAMAAAALDHLPVEQLARDAAPPGDLRRLAEASGMHGIALMGPDRAPLSASGTPWTPLDADARAIARARAGEPTAGRLHRGPDGGIYLPAYAPLPNHPGWVAAIEGSAAPLEAAEDMETLLGWGSALVMLMAALAGAVLAAGVARPLGRLARDLGDVRPGDAPSAVALGGPREVQQVAGAARALLQAVRERDEALRVAHDREMQQISALAAAVAHEVRNPLNAVGLAVQRLERVEGPEGAALRARVRTLLGDIEGIVERFMDLSRPPEPALRRVSTTAIWEDLAVDAEAVGVRLNAPDADRTVHTDPSLVRQALRNLLRNAAESGARTVTVRVAREAPLSLLISDDGPGIPPDQADRLFDWFHTTRAQGSGLGLPSARRALRAVGGDLALADPVGATFRITLERER